MDWLKINMDEVFYYCKSNEVDFDCNPLSLQLEELVIIFYYYGIRQFTIKDIQEFYKKMQIPRMRSEGIIKPNPGKIRKVMERMQNIQCISDGTFEIIPASKGLYLPFDISIYSCHINKGYKK